MKRPVVLMAGAYVLGIFTARFKGSLLFPALFLIISLIILIKSGKKTSVLALTAFLLTISALFFVLGLYNMERTENKFICEKLAEDDEGEAVFTAVVESCCGSDGKYRIEASPILIKQNNKEYKTKNERLMLYHFEQLSAGNIIEVKGKFKAYPGIINDGDFDTKGFYKCRNIGAYVYPDKLVKTGRKESAVYMLKYALEKLRNGVNRSFILVFGTKRGGVLSAMFTGDKTRLEEEVKESYKTSGIGHLLAISGLHISMIGMSIYVMLRKCGKSIGFSGGLAMMFLFLFSLFSGEQVSCIRAGTMLCFIIGAKYFGRKYDLLTALSFSALVILIKNPLYLSDASFLLSFSAGAAAGLAGFVSRKAELVGKGKIRQKMIRAIMFSFMLQMLILPVQLDLFYTYNVYSPLINVLLVPLMPVLLVFSLASLIASLFSPFLTHYLSLPAKLILDLYFDSGSFAGELPGARAVSGRLKLYHFLIALIIVGFILFLIDRSQHKTAFAVSSLMLVLLVGFPEKGFEFYQLYVGQGACYVIFSDGDVIVCDCGSMDKDDIYEHTLLPFLYYHGYDRIDYCIVSHADKDHFSGFEEMLEEADFRPCFIIPEYKDMSAYAPVLDAAKNDRADMVTTGSFKSIKLAGLRLEMLFPDTENAGKPDNDSSAVFKLVDGDRTILFTGDISAEKERYIIKQCEEKAYQLKADVLMVAHHGSRFSTCDEFLEKVQPDIAMISCGINNSYGHPAKETIKKLKKTGCEIHISSKEGQYRIAH